MHGGNVAVALTELEGGALGERAGEDAGRLEALQHRQHCFNALQRAAELRGEFRQIAGEIAVVVELVDQADADRPPGGVGELQIGRASCRERVWPYVEISVDDVSLKKQIH